MNICLRRREFIAGLGGAVAWPLAVGAQQRAMPVIGFLHSGLPGQNEEGVAAFRRGLADAGFVEYKNVTIEFRWANLQFRQLPSLVSDLINRQVAVIFAASSSAPIQAAKAATATIPIVFYYGGDPVKDGFVASLSRPGGNMTGLTGMESELGPKRLALLHERQPRSVILLMDAIGQCLLSVRQRVRWDWDWSSSTLKVPFWRAPSPHLLSGR